MTNHVRARVHTAAGPAVPSLRTLSVHVRRGLAAIQGWRRAGAGWWEACFCSFCCCCHQSVWHQYGIRDGRVSVKCVFQVFFFCSALKWGTVLAAQLSIDARVCVSPTSQRFYRFNDCLCLCVAYITTVLSIQWLPMSVCRLHHNGFIDSVTAYVCVSPTSQRIYRFSDCLSLCVAYITMVLSIDARVCVSPTSQRFYRLMPVSVCRLHHNGSIDWCPCLCVAYITTVLAGCRPYWSCQWLLIMRQLRELE